MNLDEIKRDVFDTTINGSDSDMAIVSATIDHLAARAILQTWRKEADWHEDLGPAIWCSAPVREPYYAGCPLSDDWTDDYYTHFILMRDLPPPPTKE